MWAVGSGEVAKGRMSDGHAYSYTLRFIVFALHFRSISYPKHFISGAALERSSFYLRAFRFLFFMAHRRQ